MMILDGGLSTVRTLGHSLGLLLSGGRVSRRAALQAGVVAAGAASVLPNFGVNTASAAEVPFTTEVERPGTTASLIYGNTRGDLIPVTNYIPATFNAAEQDALKKILFGVAIPKQDIALIEGGLKAKEFKDPNQLKAATFKYITFLGLGLINPRTGALEGDRNASSKFGGNDVSEANVIDMLDGKFTLRNAAGKEIKAIDNFYTESLPAILKLALPDAAGKTKYPLEDHMLNLRGTARLLVLMGLDKNGNSLKDANSPPTDDLLKTLDEKYPPIIQPGLNKNDGHKLHAYQLFDALTHYVFASAYVKSKSDCFRTGTIFSLHAFLLDRMKQKQPLDLLGFPSPHQYTVNGDVPDLRTADFLKNLGLDGSRAADPIANLLFNLSNLSKLNPNERQWWEYGNELVTIYKPPVRSHYGGITADGCPPVPPCCPVPPPKPPDIPVCPKDSPCIPCCGGAVTDGGLHFDRPYDPDPGILFPNRPVTPPTGGTGGTKPIAPAKPCGPC